MFHAAQRGMTGGLKHDLKPATPIHQQAAEKRPSAALPSSLITASRSSLRGSFLGISGALHLAVFSSL
jgi:hypothetical protein